MSSLIITTDTKVNPMDNQLEHIRDIWINAFFTGNVKLLVQYEHADFKVVYEQQDRVESSLTRYDRIAHAVKNGVWKPQKPEVTFEEFEFDYDLTRCQILMGLMEGKKIQERWVRDEVWNIIELRFLK